MEPFKVWAGKFLFIQILQRLDVVISRAYMPKPDSFRNHFRLLSILNIHIFDKGSGCFYDPRPLKNLNLKICDKIEELRL